jgi:geranylgeranyl reductase family protein
MIDVAIVGAGPAGACAALALASKGLSVVLLEKAALPRYKTCGGGLVRRAQKLLPVDVSPVIERQLNLATMTLLTSGLSFEARHKEALISMTMRSELDHLLVTSAEKAGARVCQGIKVLGLSFETSSITLTTTRESYPARFVVAADGVHSIIAKAAGWPNHSHLAPALESEIRVADKDLERFCAAARFDFDIPARGYAWVFPKRDHLSVGVLSVQRRDRDLGDALRRYLQAVGLNRVLHEERHGSLIPLAPRAGPLARDRVLLVGDAAGLADPVTAEGISGAVRSGQLAAEAIIKGKLCGGDVERLYDDLVNQELRPELKAGRWLARMLYDWPALRNWLFKRHGAQLTSAMAGVLAGDRTYRALLADWRNYLRLLPIPAGLPRIGRSP